MKLYFLLETTKSLYETLSLLIVMPKILKMLFQEKRPGRREGRRRIEKGGGKSQKLIKKKKHIYSVIDL